MEASQKVSVDGPLYIRPWIYKGQALLLRYLLLEAAAGYSRNGDRAKLLKKIEDAIAEAWPEEALR